MNWKNLLEGLIVAVVGGGATTAADYLSSPANITGVALGKRTGIVAGVGALLGLSAWLRTSPLTRAQIAAPEPAQKESEATK